VKRAGDEGFAEAFPRLFTRAYHVALPIVGDAGEAEDVAAEALARTLRSWRRVRAMDAPEAWVVRVATNVAIDVLRRRRWVCEPPAELPVGPDDADTRVTLRELVRTLPRRQRDVVALRYLVDLSEVEVASLLGIAQGSVKGHASRGLARLRQRLTVVEAAGVEAAGPAQNRDERGESGVPVAS
jgi:RNA polymerase sigma factor (sigma-70 family)